MGAASLPVIYLQELNACASNRQTEESPLSTQSGSQMLEATTAERNFYRKWYATCLHGVESSGGRAPPQLDVERSRGTEAGGAEAWGAVVASSLAASRWLCPSSPRHCIFNKLSASKTAGQAIHLVSLDVAEMM